MKLLIGKCKICKIGNSVGLTIPSKVCKSLEIRKDDVIEMYYSKNEKKLEIFLSNKL